MPIEKIIEKIDTIGENILAEIERKPVVTAIKLLVVYWVFKKIQEMSK